MKQNKIHNLIYGSSQKGENFSFIHIFSKLFFGLFIFILISIIGLFSLNKTYAAQYTIGNALEITFENNSLFNAKNLVPGSKLTKTMMVKNIGIYNHSLSVATSGVNGKLAQALEFEAKVNGNTIWKKSLSAIAESPNTNIIVLSINPGETVGVDLVASLPADLGNEYQNLNINAFNFYLGYESSDQTEPANSTSTASSQSSLSNYYTIPFFESNTTPSTEPTASSSTTSSPTVKSETTSSANTTEEVKGAQDEKTANCPSWVILLILFILLIFYAWYQDKNKKIIYPQIWPIILVVVAYLIHFLIHDKYASTIFCQYFIIFELIILVLYYLSKNLFNSKESDSK